MKNSYVTPPIFDFSNVDWYENNTTIAKKLGCSRQLVAVKREKYGKDNPETFGKHSISSFKKIKTKGLDISSMTSKEIAKKLGIKVSSVHQMFTGKFIRSYRHKYEWSKISDEDYLDKTDKEIAGILGCRVIDVILRRVRMGIYRKPAYRKRFDWSVLSDKECLSMPVMSIARKIGCTYSNAYVHVKRIKKV